MSPRISITSDQEYFQRQIEEFNADRQRRWQLQRRKAHRRRNLGLATLLDAAEERRIGFQIRWFGPVRWILNRSKQP